MSYRNDRHSDNCDLQIAQIDPSQALSTLDVHGPKTTGLNAWLALRL